MFGFSWLENPQDRIKFVRLYGDVIIIIYIAFSMAAMLIKNKSFGHNKLIVNKLTKIENVTVSKTSKTRSRKHFA